jgi:hypothetical protein
MRHQEYRRDLEEIEMAMNRVLYWLRDQMQLALTD